MRSAQTRWEMTALFLLGGVGYLALELAWRGMTHWSMFWAGGACLCLLQALGRGPVRALPAQAGLGTAGVCVIELTIGVLTRGMGLEIWDYSAEWGNVAGLICPKYTLLWYLLCLWLLGVMRLLQRWTALPQKTYKQDCICPAEA